MFQARLKRGPDGADIRRRHRDESFASVSSESEFQRISDLLALEDWRRCYRSQTNHDETNHRRGVGREAKRVSEVEIAHEGDDLRQNREPKTYGECFESSQISYSSSSESRIDGRDRVGAKKSHSGDPKRPSPHRAPLQPSGHVGVAAVEA